jgi:hypothetical protein
MTSTSPPQVPRTMLDDAGRRLQILSSSLPLSIQHLIALLLTPHSSSSADALGSICPRAHTEPRMNGNALPLCCICTDVLGAYGGEATLCLVPEQRLRPVRALLTHC